MYWRSTLSSVAVQYLWNVYATLSSKGSPKTEKLLSHYAPRERECGERQPFVSRLITSCRAVQARNLRMLVSENAESAHSAGHNRARSAHRDSAWPAGARWRSSVLALVDSGIAKDIPRCHRCSCPSVRPARHADQGSHRD